MAVVNQWNINGSNPVTVGGTGITAKYFTQPSGNFTQGSSTTPSSTNATGQLAIRGDNEFNGQQFSVQASGNFEVGAGGACPAVTIEMVGNTGTLLSPTYTVLATTGPITVQNNVGLFYPWQIEIVANGDTQSGILSGYQTSVVDNTLKAPVALSNTLSGLNFSGNAVTNFPGGPVFGIVMRITFSVSEPGNAANMFMFNVQS
jgi:hypothetical protein